MSSNTKELSSKFREVTPEEFVLALKSAKKSIEAIRAWRVDSNITAKDYEAKGARCFVSQNGSTLAVTADADIISVCVNNADKGIIKGAKIIELAIEMGGNHLDCFSGLTDFYKKCGFEEKGRFPWNHDYDKEMEANGWKPEYGEEDIVLFELPSAKPLVNEMEIAESEDSTPSQSDIIKAMEDEFAKLPFEDKIGEKGRLLSDEIAKLQGNNTNVLNVEMNL